MKLEFIACPSPNFGIRDAGIPLRFVILHYTGMASGKASLAHLCNPTSEVSAHYMIEEDGRIFSLVDEPLRAWHAGKGCWRGITDMNSASIGIELVNPGHRYGYRPFPDRQIVALEELLRDIAQRHALAGPYLLAHADIAPERKEDPGELFPWQRLAQNGFGLWPHPQTEDYAPCDDGEAQRLLCEVGYNCSTSGHYDPQTHKCLIAFQRHYEPENLTGTPEPETIARLRALARSISQFKPGS